MNTEYFVYVSLGYTGRFVKCSKREFSKVLALADSKFDVIETEEGKESFIITRYYAFVDYGVKDGIVSEQFAYKTTLK